MPININGFSLDSTLVTENEFGNVVTDGLILHLDSQYRQSYPRGGTTWYDLSGVIGDVNINNNSDDWSFQQDPETGQYCIYNINNRASGNSPGIDIPMNNGFNKVEGTFEAWLKPMGDLTGGHGWFNNTDGTTATNADNWFWIGTWDTSNAFYFRQGNPGFCCNDVFTSGFPTYYPIGEWHHWTVTWNVAAGRGTVYRDSTVFLSRTDLPTNIPNTNPSNTGQIFNGHVRADNMQFKGYSSIYKLYNRELSASEVTQNFDATKRRFNM